LSKFLVEPKSIILRNFSKNRRNLFFIYMSLENQDQVTMTSTNKWWTQQIIINGTFDFFFYHNFFFFQIFLNLVSTLNFFIKKKKKKKKRNRNNSTRYAFFFFQRTASKICCQVIVRLVKIGLKIWKIKRDLYDGYFWLGSYSCITT